MNTGYNHIRFKDPRLARYIPTDFEHFDKYPLSAAPQPSRIMSVPAGVNWYKNFDAPIKDTKDGRMWVGTSSNLGNLRGGHCICLPPDPKLDLRSWYIWYNQLTEGKCVGEGVCRTMSIANRKQYEVDYTWHEAKENDEWSDTNRGDNNGTSVRAALWVTMTYGIVKKRKTEPTLSEGIQGYYWTSNIDDVLIHFDNPLYNKLAAMPFLNSWGEDYPKVVWMPCEVWQRLMNEYGEFPIITDK